MPMYEHLVDQCRNTINYWLLDEHLARRQLHNLGWKHPKLEELPDEIKVGDNIYNRMQFLQALAIEEYISNDTRANDILEAMETIGRANISIDCKIFVLCDYYITFTAHFLNHTLYWTSVVSKHLKDWQKLSKGQYWYLFEKTPWYWWKYFFVQDGQTKNPHIELTQNISILTRLESQLLKAIAIGYRTLSSISRIKTAVASSRSNQVHKESSREVLRLLHTCNLLMQEVLKSTQFAYIDENVPADGQNFGDTSLYNQYFATRLQENRREEDLVELVQSVYSLVKDNVLQMNTFEDQVYSIIGLHGRPSYLQANWVKYTAYSIAAAGILKYLYDQQYDIAAWVTDALISMSNFTTRYITEPILSMYNTIRYDKTSFSVIDSKTVEEDVKSLERMMIDFVKQTAEPEMMDIATQKAAEDAKHANLSLILPEYEKSIERPIRNVLFGELVRLILIQVQKSIVELEHAMLALDKLLRSNELNFQVLAMFPAVLVGGFGIYFGSTVLLKRKPQRELFHKIKRELRDVERLLNHYHIDITAVKTTESYDLSVEDMGRFFLTLSGLKALAEGMRGEHRETFIQDLEDLRQEDFHAVQKLNVINRMYHYYPFLGF